MELRTLRVVVAIAEHGSLTSAAGSLHLSSSAVSHTLLGLEAELEIDLFARLPRGMALTDAGKVFVVAARRTLHDAEVARTSVDEIRGLLAGELNIGTVLGCTVTAAGLIGRFSSRHPQVLVRLLPPESPDEVIERVRSGGCEVGFSWSPRVPADIDTLDIVVDPTVLVVPDGHYLGSKTCVAVSELAGERLVAPLATSPARRMFEELFERSGVAARVVAEAATDEMTLELVRVGVGCTVTFASSASAVTDRGARAVAVGDQPASTIRLLSRRRQQPTPAANAFREFARRGCDADA